MCKIKTGKAVKSQADVRNLITAVILRQKKDFEKDTISSLVQYYLIGSLYEFEKGELQELVDYSLDLYCRNKELKCQNGVYTGVMV